MEPGDPVFFVRRIELALGLQSGTLQHATGDTWLVRRASDDVPVVTSRSLVFPAGQVQEARARLRGLLEERERDLSEDLAGIRRALIRLNAEEGR